MLRRIEPTDPLLPAGSEETFDGLLRDSDAPCFVAKETPRGPTDSLSGLPAEEADHLTVRRNGRPGNRRARRRALQVGRLAEAEVLAHIGRPCRDPEMYSVDVFSKGVKGRPEVPISECDSAADRTGDAPQHRARDRVPVVDGPETRRNPPIRRFVVVLKRPDAVARHVDRKSTRLNSSHRTISYAVFCLKKKRSRSLHCLN